MFESDIKRKTLCFSIIHLCFIQITECNIKIDVSTIFSETNKKRLEKSLEENQTKLFNIYVHQKIIDNTKFNASELTRKTGAKLLFYAINNLFKDDKDKHQRKRDAYSCSSFIKKINIEQCCNTFCQRLSNTNTLLFSQNKFTKFIIYLYAEVIDENSPSKVKLDFCDNFLKALQKTIFYQIKLKHKAEICPIEGNLNFETDICNKEKHKKVANFTCIYNLRCDQEFLKLPFDCVNEIENCYEQIEPFLCDQGNSILFIPNLSRIYILMLFDYFVNPLDNCNHSQHQVTLDFVNKFLVQITQYTYETILDFYEKTWYKNLRNCLENKNLDFFMMTYEYETSLNILHEIVEINYKNDIETKIQIKKRISDNIELLYELGQLVVNCILVNNTNNVKLFSRNVFEVFKEPRVNSITSTNHINYKLKHFVFNFNDKQNNLNSIENHFSCASILLIGSTLNLF